MHEVGVLKHALETVEAFAQANNIAQIAKVVLEVGELTGIIPTMFDTFYPILTEDWPLFKGTQLEVIIRPGRGLCSGCRNMYNVFKHEGVCPACGSRDKTVISGTELIIREITVETGESTNGNQNS